MRDHAICYQKEPCCGSQPHRSDANQSSRLQLRILRQHMSDSIVYELRWDVPLNFFREIIESSYFSSSSMMTFLLLPSPIIRRVLPQEKSSIHQSA